MVDVDAEAQRCACRWSHQPRARSTELIDRRGAQRRDDVGEVLHVLDLDIDQDLEEIDRAVGDLEIGDVARLLADHGGEAAEAAGLVARA